MADVLDLDPGGYAGTYKLIAGTAVLDFANLVSYRGFVRSHDWLDPAANAHRWAEAVGLQAPSDVGIDTLRGLRELVARIFLAIADRQTPERSDIDQLGALATNAAAQRRLRFPAGASAATWTLSRASLVDELALAATEILTSAHTLARISACDECRWLYLDTTRNHSRRWCDPADCGNRARQRRHYHRNRPAPPGELPTVDGGGR